MSSIVVIMESTDSKKIVVLLRTRYIVRIPFIRFLRLFWNPTYKLDFIQIHCTKKIINNKKLISIEFIKKFRVVKEWCILNEKILG